ncbi:hypothetical protein CGMCC3_g16241 [Colletotrichum fructicola]|nr:uncharacterized protein CGMCC3_g16241 [Colletotrichum fructicola]KAE9567564.1 hypothetical protein CGMCC3_g16241 [Colletotrichum fructicola]
MKAVLQRQLPASGLWLLADAVLDEVLSGFEMLNPTARDADAGNNGGADLHN